MSVVHSDQVIGYVKFWRTHGTTPVRLPVAPNSGRLTVDLRILNVVIERCASYLADCNTDGRTSTAPLRSLVQKADRELFYYCFDNYNLYKLACDGVNARAAFIAQARDELRNKLVRGTTNG